MNQEHLWCSSIYLFIEIQRKHRNLFQELAAADISKSLSLTDFGSDLLFTALTAMILTRGLVCCCLSLSGNHIPLGHCDWQMSSQHGIDGPGALAPLSSAQIATLNSVGGFIHGTEYLHSMQVFLMCFPEDCNNFQIN